MIVTVDRSDLKEAIEHIKPIASGNQIAALACVLLDAHGDKLTLEATDMEQRISITVDADVDEEGKALISCRKLSDIVPTLYASKVRVCVDSNAATIESGNACFNLAKIDTIEYPKWADLPDDAKMFLLTGFRLADLLKRASMCCSVRDDARPALSSVNLVFSDQKMTAVGTDSFIAAELSAPYCADQDASAIVPCKFARFISTIFCDYGEITVRIAGNVIEVSSSSVSVSSRMVETAYPQTDRLFVCDESFRARVPYDVLLSMIARSRSVLADREPILINFSDRLLGISAVSGDGSAFVDSTPADCSGEGELYVNPSLLMRAVKAVGGPNVELGYIDKLKPLMVYGSGGDGRSLVMPVRGAA